MTNWKKFRGTSVKPPEPVSGVGSSLMLAGRLLWRGHEVKFETAANDDLLQ